MASLKLVVPWFRGPDHVQPFISGLERQETFPDEIVFIDSSGSESQTRDRLEARGYHVHVIPPRDFDHGRTRNLGVSLGSLTDITVFMSQDAYLHGEDSLTQICAPYKSNSLCAAVLGQQIPRSDAPLAERALRRARFPDYTYLANNQSGYRQFYFSNAFASYRTEALLAIGGFQEPSSFGEDAFASQSLQTAGWLVEYNHLARASHSHYGGLRETYERTTAVTQSQIPSTPKGLSEKLRIVNEELAIGVQERSPSMIASTLTIHTARLAALLGASFRYGRPQI